MTWQDLNGGKFALLNDVTTEGRVGGIRSGKFYGGKLSGRTPLPLWREMKQALPSAFSGPGKKNSYLIKLLFTFFLLFFSCSTQRFLLR